MTLVRNKRTNNWEADFSSGTVGRLHVSLRTKRKSVGMERHTAMQLLVREGPYELIEDLRAGRVTVEAITRAHMEHEPLTSLLRSTQWPTIGDATALHLSFLREQTDSASSSVDARERFLNHAITRFGADRRIDTVTHEEVGAWKVDLLLRGAQDKPIKPWSAAQYLIHLGALYRWLTRQEERRAMRERRPTRILHNPVESEMIAERSAPRVRYLTKEEALRLLVATPDSHKAAVALGLFAGLRIGEVVTLRPPPHDIDLDPTVNLITIQEKEGWRPKSRKRREVPIAPELLPILMRHLDRHASDLWLFPNRAIKETVRGKPNDHITRAAIELRMRTIVPNAGLIAGQKHPLGVTFHTLRHTFASWLVMAGVDLFTVAKLMGHADTKQVEMTYAHLAPSHKALAVGMLGDGLSMEGVIDDEGEEV